MEHWKDVPGYEGLYVVSDRGELKNRYGHHLKTSDLNGYERAYLYKNSKRKCVMVHRLVAYAFIGIPECDDLEINHKDGNKKNNIVENLEWCTKSENVSHSFRIGLREQNKRHLFEATRKKVVQYTADGKLVREWECMSDAARALNINVSNISFCCSGRTKTAGGYVWELASGF